MKSKLSLSIALLLSCVAGTATAADPVSCERYTQALVELVQQDKALPGVELPEVKFRKDIRVGQHSPYLTAIRAQFDLPHGKFDKELQTLIKQYQSELGLYGTGVIDAHTLVNLVPLSAEFRERVANEVAEDCSRIDSLVATNNISRYIEVNLASQNLRAYEVNPFTKRVTEILRTKVAVGGPNVRTSLGDHEIAGLHINPSWVPSLKDVSTNLGVKRKGLTTRWLESNKIEVTDLDGKPVDYASLNIDNWDSFIYKQPYTEKSHLGKVRFETTQPAANMLHATPDMKVFDRNVRFANTATIKVEDAKLVAQWIAGGLLPESAESQSFDDAYNGEAPDLKRYVSEEGPVPVFITYRQLEFKDDGTPVYFADIYDIRKPVTLDPYHELDAEPVLSKSKASKAKTLSKFEKRAIPADDSLPTDLPPK